MTINWWRSAFSYFSVFLLVGVIVFLPGYTNIAKNLFYVLGLIAIGNLIVNYKAIKNFSTFEKLFFTIVVLNFIWIAFSFYINESPGRGSSFLWSRQFHFLLIIPLYVLFRQIKVSDLIIWISVFLSVLLSFIVVYIEGKTGHGIVPGMHRILFGSIQLCLAGYLFFSFLYQTDKRIKLLSLLGVVLALTLVILSESRGVWFAIPVLILFFFFYLAKNWSWFKKIVIFSFLGVLIISSYSISHVKNRVDLTVNNLQAYINSQNINDKVRGSSIGTRFEMWKAGWKMFLENPITGVGLGGYDQVAKANAEKYNLNKSAYWFYHPHNQYISALATRGIPGFILLLAMIFVPIMIAHKHREHFDSKEAALFIIYISLSYALFGLSDVPFEGKAVIIFYVLMMALFLSRLSLKMNTHR